MNYHEFLARVRELGEYASQAEAEQVTRNVLSVLGRRLVGGEAKDLAAQLPAPLPDVLLAAAGPTDDFGVEEFLRRVAATVPESSEQTALWDASAVLTTLAEAISGGQLNQLLSQLQSGYAPLFGKPDLA